MRSFFFTNEAKTQDEPNFNPILINLVLYLVLGLGPGRFTY